jgi:hypothetical protein
MKDNCPKGFGIRWVWENHPDQPYDDELGCTCGEAMPCECNGSDPPDMNSE